MERPWGRPGELSDSTLERRSLSTSHTGVAIWDLDGSNPLLTECRHHSSFAVFAKKNVLASQQCEGRTRTRQVEVIRRVTQAGPAHVATAKNDTPTGNGRTATNSVRDHEREMNE